MKGNSRKSFLKKISAGVLSFSVLDITFLFSWRRKSFFNKKSGGIFFTTGFKVSLMPENKAVVWTRLCSRKEPNPITHKRREKVFRHPIDFDESQPVETMDGAVAGTSGLVRAKISSGSEEKVSEWTEVDSSDDYTAKFSFENLKEGQAYDLELEARTDLSGPSTVTQGSFRTAPVPDKAKPVSLVTSSCQYFWSYDDEKRGFKSYDSMRALNPDFFIQTGDYIYYDKPGPLAKNRAEARHKWHAMDSRPSLRDLYQNVPMYMLKDDHDLLKNDVYPTSSPYGELTFEDGLKLWYENVPLREQPYYTIRWGKDLEVWVVEGREYRSENSMEDGPEKTIWGEEQKSWLKRTMEKSNASFKILFSATPVVGPDRKNKTDNHANDAFASEGRWLRQYLSDQQGTFVVNGDRHWQYVSEDKETGLIEIGSGPVSDFHAQGWEPGDVRPEHRFLRVKGGFLGIAVDRENNVPFIQFRHYDVNGTIMNEEKFN